MRAAGRVGFFSPTSPRVIAHRGLALEAPENTLLAFVKAMAAGAHYLETDVHVSADGVAVISHDPDLRRLAGRDVAVSQLTAPELRRIDLGAGQGFATLAEALDGLPDARFNIDVKVAGAAAPAARAILETGAADRVLVTGFSDAVRRSALVALAEGGAAQVATSASQSGVISALTGARIGSGMLVRRALAGVQAVQVPERQGVLRVVDRRFVEAVHRVGAEVHVWTVDEASAMHRLLDLGVDGIITNRCDVAVAVLAERG